MLESEHDRGLPSTVICSFVSRNADEIADEMPKCWRHPKFRHRKSKIRPVRSCKTNMIGWIRWISKLFTALWFWPRLFTWFLETSAAASVSKNQVNNLGQNHNAVNNYYLRLIFVWEHTSHGYSKSEFAIIGRSDIRMRPLPFPYSFLLVLWISAGWGSVKVL